MTKTVSSVPKRKADEELRGTVAKSPRIGLLPNGARQGGDKLKSSTLSTNKPSFAGSSSAKSASVPRPSDRTTTPAIRKESQDTPSRQRQTSTSANGSRSVPARPLAKRPSPVDSGPKPEPKKRSFAEIMARAKAAQAAGPNLGKIQHKTLEKGVSKKEREEMKAEGARKAKTAAKQGAMRNGGGVPRDRDGARRGTSTTPPRGSTNRKAGKAPVVEEKKVKKAALATTGYTGTARPRPGAASSKSKGSSSAPNSASRARPADSRRYGGALSSSRRQYDEEDEDMDDFIEYDDDEPAYGHGGPGGYDSAEESDMEAGLSDIDEEERRAEYQARREDQQQEALEKRLKREKEERRRQLLNARAARR